jgi:DNA-binding NtrC family response regulator
MTEPWRVLAVDDEAEACARVAAALAHGGFAVEVAASGEQALARLRQGGIDLVVTDLRLSGMSGLELVREARRDGVGASVIVITAHASVEDAVIALKLGAFDVLTKPFSPTDLLHLASRTLEHERESGGGTRFAVNLAGLTVREVERRLIMDTLGRTGNNRTHAARLLGISIRTLRNKLAEYRQRGEREPAAVTGK